ncbi:site-specific integrase [Pseudaminobacter sp. 19-2017]|uniref:Site-specific integrase n=1 Tax=Pseudaminobacter soli (ex Zhang et al. 2022) TaxID=2831468 RepID=A0A942E2X5_9HYPH|nr:site-specific integrase [Pseudaminobacter soli]MBS3650036.1 site-specific integrase [Pseudaminobacter soli]
MPDRHHLHNRNGVWYYRRRVPDTLIKSFGKSLIQHSLNTTSLQDAKRLRNALDIQYDLEFEALRTSSQTLSDSASDPSANTPARLSIDEVRRRVAAYVDEQVQKFDQRYLNDPAGSLGELREIRSDKQAQLQDLSDPEHPDQHLWVHQAYSRVFPEGHSFDGITETGVAEMIRRSLVSIISRELAILRDDFGTSSGPATSPSKLRTEVTFGRLASEYVENVRETAKLNRRRPQWAEKVAAQAKLLVEVIGADTPIQAVDYDAGRKLQRVLARLPAHREKRYPGEPYERAIELAAKDNRHVLTPTSQAAYLDDFRNIMQLALKKQLIASNPAEDLRPLTRDPRSPADKRRPFTPDQIRQFFSSSFYARWHPESKEPYLAKDRDWRFWLPLLMALTGMRPGEICQMQAGDIRRSSTGVWYAYVEPTDDDAFGPVKKIKTSHSRRSFPIHPQLIEVGFLDFVEGRRKDGDKALLFAGLKPSRRGYYSDYPCRRFRETFLKQGLELEPGQTLYSFRHSFRDALRRIDAPSDVLSALGGWSEGTKVSDGYGDPKDADYLAKFVAKIHYPGLKLGFRYSQPAPTLA